MKPILKIEEREEQKVFTVSEFIDFLNKILVPHRAVIQGEVAKDIYARSHYSIFYLLDKNEEAILKCFVWQERLENLGAELKEGMEVKVLGYPKIYKPRGEFSFEVEQIGLIGEGVLKKAFEILKKKLAKVGFFDPERKKSIPRFCQKIGLITSQYGKGALPDFRKHLRRHGFQIYFYDARVEGLFAIDEITQAIRWFNENMLNIDVLVLIRGGGSWESLQAFNSESVAKAIFASKIPIICGIGHEKDETIADYVADLHASTPTDAARILSDPWRFAKSQITIFERNIISTIIKICKYISESINFFESFFNGEIAKKIEAERKKINYLTTNLDLSFRVHFQRFYQLEKEFLKNYQMLQLLTKKIRFQLQQLLLDLNQSSQNWIKDINRILLREKEKLNLASPEFRLKQGYSITFDELSGKVIKKPAQLKVNTRIKTKLYRGGILSKVEKILKR